MATRNRPFDCGPGLKAHPAKDAGVRGRLERALREYVDCADWYRRCLEGVIDRQPVRGLGEARVGYDTALDAACA